MRTGAVGKVSIVATLLERLDKFRPVTVSQVPLVSVEPPADSMLETVFRLRSAALSSMVLESKSMIDPPCEAVLAK